MKDICEKLGNPDNEKEVIGILLTKPDLIYDKALEVEPEHFFNPQYGEILKAILHLQRTNQPCDFITVSTYLKDIGKLDVMGGRPFITELVNNVITTSNIQYYVNILMKNYVSRTIYSINDDINRMVLHGENPDEIIAKQMEALHRLILKEKNIDNTSLLDTPNYISDTLLCEDDEEPDLFYTLFPELDKMLTGIERGDLVAIGGHTSMGKSVFAGCLSKSAKHQELPVTIFTLEMKTPQYVRRLVASEADVCLNKFKSKDFTNDEIKRIRQVEKDFFGDFDLTIYDRAGIDTNYIRQKLMIEQRKHGELGVVIIDHIHLMHGMGQTERQQISQIAETLKALAMEFNCYMIMLCQFARKEYKDRETGETIIPRPSLSDFKESGDIENVANIAILIHRSDRSSFNAEAIVAKNRDGSLGSVFLDFFGQYAKFKSSKRTCI